MPSDTLREQEAATTRRPLRAVATPQQLAWIAVLPCALVTVGAVVLLGPPIGHAFMQPHGEQLWPREAVFVFGEAEPAKHARYLLALLAPALLAACVLAVARRPLALPVARARALAAAGQALVLALLAVALLAQYGILPGGEEPPWRIFDAPTLAAAVVLPALLLLALRNPARAARVAGWLRDSGRRRLAALGAAALYAVAWLLAVVDSDATIGFAQTANLIPWGMDDPFAILDGRTPLVDFHVLYAQLWAYPIAGALRVFGATVTVYTVVLAALGVATLLALYAILRRVARSAIGGLLLYVPVVATGFLSVVDPAGIALSNVRIFSVWPLRYAIPYTLAWLTVRHVDGAAPCRAWPLFLVAGIGLIDNLEFGAAALAATVAALASARLPHSRRAAGRLAVEAVAGLLAAALLVVLVTLVRSGELPRYRLLLEFPHVFGVLGLTAVPMPTLGVHLVVYTTFLAAIGAAVVRSVGAEANRALTGMLAWSGVFGLLAGSYYVGRSDELKLAALLSPWALALALLALLVVGALASRGWRRPRLAELAVLAGCGIAVALVLQTPTPWSQIERLGRTSKTPMWVQPQARRFVAVHTQPGERIATLVPMGHRIAHDLGLDDVAPYAYVELIVTRRQMATFMDAVRDAHVHKLFVPEALLQDPHRAVLAAAGFAPSASAAGAGVTEWVDAAAAQ